jgi:hypothetical protein
MIEAEAIAGRWRQFEAIWKDSGETAFPEHARPARASNPPEAIE